MKLSRQKLRHARTAKSLSQPQLADAVGMKVGTLRSFEQGRHHGLKAETVYAIARVLDVPMEDLFDDADETALVAGGGR